MSLRGSRIAWMAASLFMLTGFGAWLFRNLAGDAAMGRFPPGSLVLLTSLAVVAAVGEPFPTWRRNWPWTIALFAVWLVLYGKVYYIVQQIPQEATEQRLHAYVVLSLQFVALILVWIFSFPDEPPFNRVRLGVRLLWRGFLFLLACVIGFLEMPGSVSSLLQGSLGQAGFRALQAWLVDVACILYFLLVARKCIPSLLCEIVGPQLQIRSFRRRSVT